MRTRLLIVAVGAAVLVVAGVVTAILGHVGKDEPSPDCQQAERALQPLGATMPEVFRNLPPDVVFPSDRDVTPDYAAAAAREARAANEIRAQADVVETAALRARLYEVAEAFDDLSHSRMQPSTAATSGFFAATTRMNEALHGIKQACPTIGEEAPAPPVRR